MKVFLLVIISFIIILTIFRRIIEPFKEGLSGNLKSYNRPPQPKAKPKPSGWVANAKKEKNVIDTKNIEDADFKEIQ